MKKITILLPLHKIDDEYSVMLNNAVSSLEDFHNDVILMIICPPNVKNSLSNLFNS